MPPATAEMEPLVKDIKIPVPWGYIRGKWWGSEDIQPVLAVHGWMDNAASFDNLAPLLLPEVSLLCIDLPGHGRSCHYPKGMMYYLFWDTLITIRRVVKHYNWQKVSLIGHSLGGAGGFLYAAIYPDQIDKLIQIDIACPRVGVHDEVTQQMAGYIDRFLKYETVEDRGAVDEFDAMVLTALHGYNKSLTEESCEVLMSRGLTVVDEQSETYRFSRDIRLKVAGLAMFSKEEILEYAAKIKCKVMNIRGDPGLKFEVPEMYSACVDAMRKSARKFELHKVRGTHHVHLNDPTLVSELILNFLLDKPNTDAETLVESL